MEPTKESNEAAFKLLEATQTSFENGRIYGEKDFGVKILKAYNDSSEQMKAYEIIELIFKLLK